MRQQAGSYVLLIELPHETAVRVGRLGMVTFSGGFYLYVGSALGGLRARITRHLRRDKRLHWHIDYLLQVSHAVEVWIVYSQDRLECGFAEAVLKMGDTQRPVKGFGSSDCLCESHLFYRKGRPHVREFQVALDEINPGCVVERL